MGTEQLHRHVAVQPQITGRPDLAHPAPAHDLDERVAIGEGCRTTFHTPDHGPTSAGSRPPARSRRNVCSMRITWRHGRGLATLALRPGRRRRTGVARARSGAPTSVDGAWIDLLPGWLTGADVLFERLAADGAVAGRASGRCTTGWSTFPASSASTARTIPCPTPSSTRPGPTLSSHYADELGEPFRTAGLCYYRDGRDSVAWHGDTIGRGSTEDTMVAIVSVGAPRELLLRPRGGGDERPPRPRPRRPPGDGRLLPAHLGARRAEAVEARRPPHQHPVPAPRRAMTGAGHDGRRRSRSVPGCRC